MCELARGGTRNELVEVKVKDTWKAHFLSRYKEGTRQDAHSRA